MIPTIGLIIAAALVIFYFIKQWSQSPSYLKHRIKDRDETIKDLKHKYNVVNGKYARIRNEEFLDQDVVQQSAEKFQDNPEEAINALLDNAAPRLGKLGKLAKNPLVRKLISDAVKKYPKESAEIAASVLPKLSEFTEEISGTPEVSRL